MKKFITALLVLVMVFGLCACGSQPVNTPVVTDGNETTAPETTAHVHVFSEATCLEAATCSCGETEGEVAGHLFMDATCEQPMTCSVCDTTEGSPLGHDYSAASCVEAATCVLCGDSDGIFADHIFQNGACVTCGEVDPSFDFVGEE